MTWTNYHNKFQQTLKKHNLLPKNSQLLIAVSGGQDSLCLAQLILDFKDKFNWEIAIVHCDHNWQLDRGLADHVAQICLNWGVKFYLKKAEKTIKETEAEARKWRYQVLTEIAEKNDFNYLLTGHTKSDRAETLVYNLIRGSGLAGLTSLSWHRPLTKKIKLVRPLLDFTRQDTLKFCQQLKLPIWQDQYNQNKKFARNKIRLDLIPYLQTNFNPQVEQHLAQTAEILKADQEYLNHQAQRLFNLTITNNYHSLNRKILAHQPLSLQRRVIKLFLEKNLQRMPNFKQIESVTKLISAPNRSRTSTLWQNIAVEVKNNLITIVKL